MERDFLHYLESEFFTVPGNVYYVLEDQDRWVSALRIYKIKPELYYLEALETPPEYQKTWVRIKASVRGDLLDLKIAGRIYIV